MMGVDSRRGKLETLPPELEESGNSDRIQITTGGTPLLAANVKRAYAEVRCEPNNTDVIYFYYGASTSPDNAHGYITDEENYRFEDGYLGAISMQVESGGSSTYVHVTELQIKE